MPRSQPASRSCATSCRTTPSILAISKRCIDAATGKLVWRERLGGIYSASPVAADGKIYLFGENGETLVLRSGRTAEVLAKNKLDMRVIASPAISGGRIFVRGDRELVAIRTGTP